MSNSQQPTQSPEEDCISRDASGNMDWRSTFDFFDRDKNGTISVQELRKSLCTLGQENTTAQIEQLLDDVGCAGEEYLDYDRFTEVLSKGTSTSKKISRSQLKAMYGTIDIDLSGYLTASEIHHFLSTVCTAMSDEEMAAMVALFDINGDNKISISEFEAVLRSMDFEIVEDMEDKEGGKPREEIGQKRNQETTRRYPASGEQLLLADLPEKAREALRLFDIENTGEVCMADLQQAADMLKTHLFRNPHDPDTDPALHWNSSREKRGLGDFVYKANHIAIIVSDVGRSVRFYADVLGLQQIRRPNFDKHGAWFTMGNVELHLIKGKPLVHSGDDLIVNHISIETYEIDQVPGRLRELGIPFRQNVSVPKGEDGGAGGKTNADKDSLRIVRQFFFRDPDGYYIEVCNCMLLTEYCLGKRSSLEGYNEGVQPLGLEEAVLAVNVMQNWAESGRSALQDRSVALKHAHKTDGSIKEIAKALGYFASSKVDEGVIEQLQVRQTVYGDICQTFSTGELEEVVRSVGNDASAASELMYLKAAMDGRREFQPPAFFEEGKTFVKPPTIDFTKIKSGDADSSK